MAFEPGESGNPSGRPKKSNKAAGMAREHTEKAIQVLVKQLDSPKEEIQHKAAESILSRGWGKPQEYIELSSDPDEPLHVTHTVTKKLLESIPTETLQKIVDESRRTTDPD